MVHMRFLAVLVLSLAVGFPIKSVANPPLLFPRSGPHYDLFSSGSTAHDDKNQAVINGVISAVSDQMKDDQRIYNYLSSDSRMSQSSRGYVHDIAEASTMTSRLHYLLVFIKSTLPELSLLADTIAPELIPEGLEIAEGVELIDEPISDLSTFLSISKIALTGMDDVILDNINTLDDQKDSFLSVMNVKQSAINQLSTIRSHVQTLTTMGDAISMDDYSIQYSPPVQTSVYESIASKTKEKRDAINDYDQGLSVVVGPLSVTLKKLHGVLSPLKKPLHRLDSLMDKQLSYQVGLYPLNHTFRYSIHQILSGIDGVSDAVKKALMTLAKKDLETVSRDLNMPVNILGLGSLDPYETMNKAISATKKEVEDILKSQLSNHIETYVSRQKAYHITYLDKLTKVETALSNRISLRKRVPINKAL